MVLDGGRCSLTSSTRSSTASPAQRDVDLQLRQGERNFVLTELPWRQGLRMSGTHSGVTLDSATRYFAVRPVADGAVLDLYQPVQMTLGAWQRSGENGAEITSVKFQRELSTPNVSAYALAAKTSRRLEAFYQRSTELPVLAVALLMLTVALIAQRRTAATRRRLQVFRVAFLAFTLGFIGWNAQVQLAALGVRALGLPQKRFRVRTDLLLKRVKYAVLLVLVGVATAVFRGYCRYICPLGAALAVLGHLRGWG